MLSRNIVTALRGIAMNNIKQCTSNCIPVQCHNWDISSLIYHGQERVNYAAMILNTPITQSQRFFHDFWNNATIRTTVDGGTRKLEAYRSNCSEEIINSLKQPDLITGDFDSMPQDALQVYESKGCKVIHTPNQMHTDFTKAIMELNTYCQQSHIDVEHFVAIVQSSRRMDQTFGNVQTMFLAKNILSPRSAVYLISEDSISWLLFPGDHIIAIPEESRRHPRAWCSLVPVGEPCKSVTSSGLKWDMNDQTLKFGELVSTSNTFSESETVKVKCSNTLLWSMRVPSFLRVVGDPNLNRPSPS